MKLIIDTTEKIDKKLTIEKAELGIKNKAEMVMYVLHNYYGIKTKKSKEKKK